MKKVAFALREAAGMLEKAGVPDPAVDAALLLSFVTGRPPLRLRAEGWEELPEGDQAAFDALIARRLTREPLQYIVGDAPFMGLMLKVTKDVLIPRADTEVLCEEALRVITPGDRVLDVCTGSGALAVALAHHSKAGQVFAGDLSAGALAVARANAAAYGLSVDFREGDLFTPFLGEKFDVIVSNPPYISDADMLSLQAEVLLEPAMALRGGADGLDFYRRIAAQAPAYLHAGGRLLLEIGSDEGAAVCDLLRGAFREVRLLPDLRGLDRVVAARL